MTYHCGINTILIILTYLFNGFIMQNFIKLLAVSLLLTGCYGTSYDKNPSPEMKKSSGTKASSSASKHISNHASRVASTAASRAAAVTRAANKISRP
ncbi:MAG: hypothetical protein COA94_01515 [Rickettsiales bacterium]|nr:MAG: hypothetical protein COA94_01515 [Rickettsiales bacterium]